MSNVNVGDRLAIHCYKHDGKIHRIWNEVVVLENNSDLLVCANDVLNVSEGDGRSYDVEEPVIMFFYKKHWFNIIAYIRKRGLFYKCNLATPVLIDNGIIKWIDYDLDLKVFPDGGFRVLDRNEYSYHKKIMGYSDDIDLIIKSELSNLIDLKKNVGGPFAKEIPLKYYEKYKSIKNLQKM